MHCDGWKAVKYVNKGFMIEVVFEDGTKHIFNGNDKVFIV